MSLAAGRPVAVLFDADDTLTTWRRFQEDHGLPAIALYLASQGYGQSEIRRWCRDFVRSGGGFDGTKGRIAAAFSECTPEQRAAITKYLKGFEAISVVDPMPYAPELLTTLNTRDIPAGVASNTRQPLLSSGLRQAGIEHLLAAVVSSSDVGVKKPQPASIELCLQRLHVTAPEQAIYIGNRPHDVEAARAAGVQPWLLASERHLKANPAVAAELKRLNVPCLHDLRAVERRILKELSAPSLSPPST